MQEGGSYATTGYGDHNHHILWSNSIATQPASAAIHNIGSGGCPDNTVVGGDNLVQNGDFAQGASGFNSALTNRGNGVYPDDTGGGGFSIQNGSVVYPPFKSNPYLFGRPFPGDVQRDVPPSNTCFIQTPVLQTTMPAMVGLICGHR